MSFRFAAFAFSAAAFLAIVASPAVRAETPPETLRIGLPGVLGPDGKPAGGWTVAPAVLAAISQEFAGTGTKIVWSYFVNAGPGINEAFAAQQIDVADYGDFPASIARAGGIDIKLLLPLSRGGTDSYLVVPPDSTAKSIQDLKGKRVSLNMGRPWALAFSRLIEANHLTMADFQIFNLVMPDGDAAVAAHTVDAQVTLEGLQLQDQGRAKIIWSTKDAPLDWKFSADLFGRAAFIQQYPDTARRLVRAYIRGALYYSDPAHRAEYLQSVSVGQTIPLHLVETAWQGREVKPTLSPLFDPFIAHHYQQVADFAYQSKMLRRPYKVDELLDPVPSQEALADLGAAHFWQPVDPVGKPLVADAKP
jgi:sulfonate transport system substrate-binding protein